MIKEYDDGNIEYKLILKNPSEQRLDELVTQMRYRCSEGGGECFYIIGVEDDGNIIGLTDEEYKETYNILKIIAERNNCSINVINKTKTDKNMHMYELFFREELKDKYIELKVAVAGNVDSGKSTTLGYLVSGTLDNGRGSARMSVFNFVHEMKTGRTSSISHEIIGYDSTGKIVNNSMNKLSWGDIVNKSSKVVTFFDLPGHQKYIKTTVNGFFLFPSICMITIAANNGISRMTKEHIFLCITLKIPFIFVITKIDLCIDRSNILTETTDAINRLLKHATVRRLPIHIKSNDDVILSAKHIYSNNTTPIFKISNVTGEGIEMLKLFFNIVSAPPTLINENNDVEYFINATFSVNGVGLVLGGTLVKGVIKVGDTLLIGPLNEGQYDQIVVKSIHSKKVNVSSVSNGGYVCLAFKKLDRKIIRRGMVLVSQKSETINITQFNATITVLKTHSTTVKIGYEPQFCCNNIKQTVIIMGIENKTNGRNVVIENDNVLRNNDTATVELKFKFRPEYIKKGMRFLLCEGYVKIFGEVI
jgi:GTPase